MKANIKKNEDKERKRNYNKFDCKWKGTVTRWKILLPRKQNYAKCHVEIN